MKTALITGDMGFIGRHLRHHLTSNGWAVFGFDFKEGHDIRRLDRCPLEYGDIDVCYHLAAQTNAQAGDAFLDADHNIMGTINVLQRFGNKVVFASSCAINYPVTPYAISKLAGEHYTRLYGGRIVRLCNIHGPGGHGVFEAFLEADTLRIAGSGTQSRTYAPVTRAVNALVYSTEPLHILWGEDLTVNQIADLWPDKPREFVPQSVNDLEVGVQVYDLPR